MEGWSRELLQAMLGTWGVCKTLLGAFWKAIQTLTSFTNGGVGAPGPAVLEEGEVAGSSWHASVRQIVTGGKRLGSAISSSPGCKALAGLHEDSGNL